MDSNESEAKPPVSLTSGSKLLSEALLIAWVPVAAYFLAFVYEQSYCIRFGVPTALVDVDGRTICSFFMAALHNWWTELYT